MGKLESKNLDYIIVNDVTDPNAGFGKDTNVVTLLSKRGTHQPFQAMAKKELAKVLFETILEEESEPFNDR